MTEEIWQLARAVVWAATPEEIAAAQARLWSTVSPDMDLYHLALWKAGLEKTDFLRWERVKKQAERASWRFA